MRVYVESEGTVEALSGIINQAVEGGEARALLILTCDENGFAPNELDPVLKEIPVPVAGGVFPMVMKGAEQLTRGSVVVALKHHADMHYVPGMSDFDVDYEDELDQGAGECEDLRTLVVFIDGLSKRIGEFVDALYAIFGLEINYIGGGAGSLSLKRKPCLITNDGLKEDGAILAALDLESGVGVNHGWVTVDGPFKVTAAEGTVIHSLDWKPAIDVYRKVVEGHSGAPFDVLPFFDRANAYPFGIARMGAERVVRDPVALMESSLICVGEVPQGEYVDILHGKVDDLVLAAGRARELAQANVPDGVKPGLGLLVDCISRTLFLKDDFPVELEAMNVPGLECVGVCTLGEIANSGKDYLEFYNKTAVVGVLEDDE